MSVLYLTSEILRSARAERFLSHPRTEPQSLLSDDANTGIPDRTKNPVLPLKRISEMNGRSCGERHTSMKNPYVPDADAEGYPVVVAQPKPGSEDEIAFRPESIVILSGKKYSQAEILEKNGGNSPFRYFEPQPYKCPSVHQGSIVTITRGGVEHSGSGPDDKPVGDRIIVDSVHRDCAVDEWSYVGIHFRTPASPRRFLPNGSLSRRCQSEKRCNA